MEWVDVIAAALVALKLLFVFVSLVFLACGLDDLFIDTCYGIWLARRRWSGMAAAQPSERQLQDRPEQPIAIMLPAWDESAVIRPMLLRLLKTLNYGNYHVFVGTYPNDVATHVEVEHVRAVSDRVHRIWTSTPSASSPCSCSS